MEMFLGLVILLLGCVVVFTMLLRQRAAERRQVTHFTIEQPDGKTVVVEASSPLKAAMRWAVEAP